MILIALHYKGIILYVFPMGKHQDSSNSNRFSGVFHTMHLTKSQVILLIARTATNVYFSLEKLDIC